MQDPSIPDHLTFSFLHVEAISGLAGRRRCQVRQSVLDTTHRAWAEAARIYVTVKNCANVRNAVHDMVLHNAILLCFL